MGRRASRTQTSRGRGLRAGGGAERKSRLPQAELPRRTVGLSGKVRGADTGPSLLFFPVNGAEGSLLSRGDENSNPVFAAPAAERSITRDVRIPGFSTFLLHRWEHATYRSRKCISHTHVHTHECSFHNKGQEGKAGGICTQSTPCSLGSISQHPSEKVGKTEVEGWNRSGGGRKLKTHTHTQLNTKIKSHRFPKRPDMGSCSHKHCTLPKIA